MKIVQILAGFVFVINFVCCAQAQPTTFFEARPVPAEVNSYYDYEKWTYSIGEYSYEIKRNGDGRRLGKTIKEFKITLEKDEFFERVVFFADYKKDILLLGELTWADTGAAILLRIDGKTLLPKWHLEIPAFNIAKGLIEGDSAYLAGIGYAAKIDLATGKEIWKHENFYRKYRESGAFNIFEVPKIEGETVVYIEKGNSKKAPNVIVFNKISGEVLEVELNQ